MERLDKMILTLPNMSFADLHAMEFQLGRKEKWSKITLEDPERPYKMYITDLRSAVNNEIDNRLGLSET